MATVAMTGGTPAPAMRQAAAQRAIKGPRAISQHAQPASATRVAGPPRLPRSSPVRQAKAQGRPAPHAKAPAPAAFNPMSGYLNSQQLAQLADRITKQNLGTKLTPLRQQAGEIRGTEGTVAKRYGGYSEATDKLLQGIGQQAEVNAKTYENQAAEAALKAGQAIGQASQTTTAQNGGYLDPQVQAELNAESELAGGVGSAQNSFAQAAGQNEQNFMGNLRAAAAQRALESQRGISTLYGGQLSKNQAQQQVLIAKQPADAKSLAAILGQQQFNDYAVQRKQNLEEGVKTAGIRQGAEKIKLTAQQNREHDRLSERGQNITATRNAATTRLEERKIAETERHNRTSENTSAERARAYARKATGGLSTPAQDKVAGELGTAWNIISQYRRAGAKSEGIRQALTLGKASQGGKTVSIPRITSQSIITAAFELYNLHKLSPQTTQALKSLGVTVPPEWTNGSFKGF